MVINNPWDYGWRISQGGDLHGSDNPLHQLKRDSQQLVVKDENDQLIIDLHQKGVLL